MSHFLMAELHTGSCSGREVSSKVYPSKMKFTPPDCHQPLAPTRSSAKPSHFTMGNSKSRVVPDVKDVNKLVLRQSVLGKEAMAELS